MDNNVLQMRCALVMCDGPRCRKPFSQLCIGHIAEEAVRVLHGKGKYNIGVQDVYKAIDGATGEQNSGIRMIVSTVVQFEDEIIRRGNV